jgi:hypothetical protein
VSRPETSQVSRWVLLCGWIAVPLVVPWLSGCSPETVEVKGGTPAPAAQEHVSAKAKAAEKAEAEIFKKTKKIR